MNSQRHLCKPEDNSQTVHWLEIASSFPVLTSTLELTVKKKEAILQWEKNILKNQIDLLQNKGECAASVASNSKLLWIKKIN